MTICSVSFYLVKKGTVGTKLIYHCVFMSWMSSFHWGLKFMLVFCLHNLALLDSVSGMPIQSVCAHVCVRAYGCLLGGGVRKQRKMKVRARKRDPRRTGFLQGLWLFLHHYPNCRQSLLTSLFPLPHHTLTHRRIHTLTVYVNRG